jgi:hypothetical protein
VADAVNIYDELLSLRSAVDGLNDSVGALASRLAALEAAARPRLRVAPVTYVYPGAKWDGFLAEKPALTQINPASGPGTAVSAAYVAQVALCRAARVPVLGYVHTKYSLRPIAEVKADIDKYSLWYGVVDIFIDTTSNKLEHLQYYVELCDYVHSKGGRVALNPGTKTIEQHAQIADWVMVCETDLATFKLQVRPSWEAKPEYAGKLWTVVHSCPAADMPYVVAEAKRRHAGLVYVTDDLMANPYDKLPTYWAALCDEVEAA